MDFDRLAKAVAHTRLSRRRAVAWGATASTALGLSMTNRPAIAQNTPAAEATPVASPHAVVTTTNQQFMFVQTASSGTWMPDSTEPGLFLLTLTGVSAQTIYFSDRPDRIVGVVTTGEFMDTLGFTPENPPNAAVVTRAGQDEDVLVVELIDPVFDAEALTLTYRARVLEDYHESGLSFLAGRQDDLELPASFDEASLFIDDCPDDNFWCLKTCIDAPGFADNVGTCWHWLPPGCYPCDQDICNKLYPNECQGGCRALSSRQVAEECHPTP